MRAALDDFFLYLVLLLLHFYLLAQPAHFYDS